MAGHNKRSDILEQLAMIFGLFFILLCSGLFKRGKAPDGKSLSGKFFRVVTVPDERGKLSHGEDLADGLPFVSVVVGKRIRAPEIVEVRGYELGGVGIV